ncbi:MAG: helix-turn-helix domain-containing protein [Chlamydiales bacterium]|nr:helix-turn-helix domain-containing protein [Chlamydiales bacterium]
MAPLSPHNISNSSEWERFFQHEEDLRESTTKKSSKVARDVFSPLSPSIEDGALSGSWNFSGRLLSPSNIQLEAVSYYEQGPFSLEELFSEAGRKRKGSLIEETPAPKRICLSEGKDSQGPISVSGEQGISGFWEPFDGGERSVPQIDGFYQMVQTAAVLGPSSGEWMSEFPLDQDPTTQKSSPAAQPAFSPSSQNIESMTLSPSWNDPDYPYSPSDIQLRAMSDYEQDAFFSRGEWMDESPLDADGNFIQFIQEELAQIEENVEGNERETDEESSQKNGIKKIDEKTISYKERIVLNEIYQNKGQDGFVKVFKKLAEQGEAITQKEVQTVFTRFKLNSDKKRMAEVQAGWPRFNVLPLPIEPGSEKLAPLPSKPTKTNNPKIQEAVVRLACESPELNYRGIANRLKELKEEPIVICERSVYKILAIKKLSTLKQRREAADVLSRQGQALYDEAALLDSSEPMEEQQAANGEQFNEERMDSTGRIVLDAICQDPLLGHRALFNLLKDKVKDLTLGKVDAIFRKYGLINKEKRIAAAQLNWPRLNAPLFPVVPCSERLVKRLMISDSKQEAVARLACENPKLTRREIANLLGKQGVVISSSSVYRVLLAKELNTIEKREQAALALQKTP